MTESISELELTCRHIGACWGVAHTNDRSDVWFAMAHRLYAVNIVLLDLGQFDAADEAWLLWNIAVSHAFGSNNYETAEKGEVNQHEPH